MVRAIRDPNGPIVNVDVVINKQNVGVLDKIVELCISLGVREFDLLHVIPQSERLSPARALVLRCSRSYGGPAQSFPSQ